MKLVQANASRLFLLMLIAISTGCSKSDESPAFSIVGNWRVTNSTSIECTNPSQNSSTDFVPSPPTVHLQMSLEYTFTSDKKVTVRYLMYTDGQGTAGIVNNGIYSLHGNKLTIKLTNPNSYDPETTEVELTGDILTMKRGRTSQFDCITIFTLIKF